MTFRSQTTTVRLVESWSNFKSFYFLYFYLNLNQPYLGSYVMMMSLPFFYNNFRFSYNHLRLGMLHNVYNSYELIIQFKSFIRLMMNNF